MLKSELKEIVHVYNLAREDFRNLVGDTPENYRVLLFINPDLHVSVNRAIELTGTPQAILTMISQQTCRQGRKNVII